MENWTANKSKIMCDDNRYNKTKCNVGQIKFYCKTCNKKICDSCFFELKHNTHQEWSKIKTLEDNYLKNLREMLKPEVFTKRYFSDHKMIDPFAIVKNLTISHVNGLRKIQEKYDVLIDEVFKSEKKMIDEIEAYTGIYMDDQDPLSRREKFLESGMYNSI